MGPAEAAAWRAERYKEARAALAYLTKYERLVVYSPIVHYHDVALNYDMPTDAGFWEKANVGMLHFARELIVLKNINWSISRGVTNERRAAGEMGKQVSYLEIIKPGEVYTRLWG